MADSTAAAAPSFGAPAAQCDVAIQRGLVHGLGVPPRVLELARTRRFRAIRGTREGAVAAALTAAAEYGRERGGFEKLAALNASLADGAHAAGLFPPTRATRPLLRFFVALRRRGRNAHAASGVAALVAKAWALLPRWVRLAFDVMPGALRDALPLHYWIATVAGGVAGGTCDVLIANALFDASHPQARTVAAIVLPVMFIGCYVASFAACAWPLWRTLVESRRRNAGSSSDLTAPAIRAWLQQSIHELAGLPASAPPLTVGALRAGRANGADAGIALSIDPAGTALGSPAAPHDATGHADLSVLEWVCRNASTVVPSSVVPGEFASVGSLPQFVAGAWTLARDAAAGAGPELAAADDDGVRVFPSA